jgi:hypothetical protein
MKTSKNEVLHALSPIPLPATCLGHLTGLDPETKQAVDTHADFVARMLVP